MPRDQSWPYLSPALPGWQLIASYRGRLRIVAMQEGVSGSLDGGSSSVVLNALQVMSNLKSALQVETRLLVVEAHFRGVTWEKIAKALGTSRQNAYKTYQVYVHAEATRQLLQNDLSYAEALVRARAAAARRSARREVDEG